MSASDALGAPLHYTAAGLPPGLGINPSTGLIGGTIAATAAQTVPYAVTVTASDGTSSASQSFRWTVSPAVTLASIPDQQSAPGDAVSLAASATDASGAPLGYSATNLPAGLGIDPSSGRIAGTIATTAAQQPYAVTVTAADGAHSASQSFTWTVRAMVTLQPLPNQSNVTGAAVYLAVGAVDATGSPLGYSATGLPPGLSINPATGFIAGTIAETAARGTPYTTTVTASDGTHAASLTFLWAVSPAVTLAALPDQQNLAGDTVSLAAGGTDALGAALTYSAVNLPSGLGINPATGLISGTMAAVATQQSFAVTVTAGDGTSSASQSFTWVVNPAVTLAAIPDQRNLLGDTVALAVSATDALGTTLTYAATNLPSGISINPATGVMAGTLGVNAAQSQTYAVTLTASDGTHGASQAFNWTVSPPVTLSAIPDQQNAAGATISLAVSGADALEAGLTFSASGLPAGLNIDPTTGTISGTITPGSGVAALYTVAVTAGDGTHAASQTFSWIVNPALTLGLLPGQQNTVGDTVSLSVAAAAGPGNALTYGATGLPGGLTIDPSSGIISGTISAGTDLLGPFAVTVTASNASGSTSETFPWAVNSAVTVTAVPDQTNRVGDSVSLTVSAVDVLGTTLTFSASGLPGGLGIDPASGVISGTLAAGADLGGPYSVTVTASDGTESASQTFTWNVNPVVTLTAIPDQGNRVGDSVSLAVAATDALAGTLTYSATGLPAGLTINQTTGLISGAIGAGADLAGPYAVTVTASDGVNSTSASCTWTVSAAVTLAAIADQQSAAGGSVSPVASATDALGASLLYSATGLPPGVTIDPLTGQFSGTVAATAAQAGPYAVTVTASDGTNSASQTFNWAVNSSVSLAALSDQQNTVGDTVSLAVSATDALGGTLTYSATGLPDGLSIDPSSGTISGTLAAGADLNGPYAVTVTASDGVNSASQSFAWTVNSTVALNAIPDQQNTEGDAVTLAVSGTAGSGASLTFSASGLPGGLGIDATTGFISGTIAAGAGGATPFEVTVTASTGTDSACRTFFWSVKPALTLAVIPDQQGVPGNVVSLTVMAADAPGATVTFSAAGLPAGLAIDPTTGIIAGTLAAGAGGDVLTAVTVTAGDGTSSASQTFVWDVNAPLTLALIPDQQNVPGDVVSIAVSATDTAAGTVTFAATGLPPGISGDPITGNISGTLAAGADLGGPYVVTVTASDGVNSASRTVNWDVSSAVTLAPLPDQQNTAGDAVTVSVSAADALGATLTFSATGLPAGLAIDPATGAVSGTIAEAAAQADPYAVTVTATDGTDSASQTFNWTVKSAVSLNVVPDQQNLPGDTVALTVTAADALGTTLTFSASGLPAGLTIDPATGVIAGTLAAGADLAGPYSVTITASDGIGSASQSFTWNVSSVTLALPPDQQAVVGAAVSLSVIATDASGGTPSYSAAGLPDGLSIDAATGIISGTVAAAALDEPYVVTVTASNGTDSASQTFNWTVNSAVTLSPIADQQNADGDVVSLSVAAADATGATLSYSASGLPDGLTMDAVSGVIGGTVAAGADLSGPYVVTVTASDGASSTEQTFTWNVAPAAGAGSGLLSGAAAPPVDAAPPVAAAPPVDAAPPFPAAPDLGLNAVAGPEFLGPLSAGNPTTPLLNETEGTSWQHTTDSGHSRDGGYSLDVTTVTTFFRTTDTAGNSFLIEDGTITYSAFLAYGDVTVVDESGVVVPFTQSFAIAPGQPTVFTNLVPGSAEMPLGYELVSDVVMTQGWDEESSTDDVRTRVSGTSRADNGVLYLFTLQTASQSATDTTNNWGAQAVADGVGDAGTQTVTRTTHGATFRYLTLSDVSANLAAGTVVGADGYPPDLLTAPAAGTKYLSRSFDMQSYNTSSTDTLAWAAADQLSSHNVRTHSDYQGLDGSLYFFNDTLASATPDGATDSRTWRIDSQRAGSYGGSQDSDLTDGGMLTHWGTLTSTSRRSDTILKNDFDYRDVYHRQAKGLSLDGTAAVQSSDNGVPSTYDDVQTVRQTFAADGSLASDLLFTFVDAAGATYSDRTDQASFTRTTSRGTTTGTLYLTQVDSSSFGGFSVATQNRLDKSSSEDSSVHTQDAGWSLTVLSSRHISADKSTRKDALSWATDTSNTALDMRVQGSFSGAGVQTGGSSSRHSLTSGSDQASDWSQAQGNGAPTLTTSVGFRGGSSGETTSTLSFAADGSPSGNMAGSASSSTATDTLTTLRGSGTLSGGSGTFDDHTDQEQQGTASSTTALLLSAGVASGTITDKRTVAGSYDYAFARTVQKGVTLDATIRNSGCGAFENSDQSSYTVSAGVVSASRTVVSQQQGEGSASVTAKGQLSDAAGHSGSWTLDTTQDNSINDTVTVSYSGGGAAWTEAGRRFDLDRGRSSSSTFHQDDNGMGQERNATGRLTLTHTVDASATAESTDRVNGTATAYTFERHRGDTAKRSEWNTSASSNGSGDRGTAATFKSRTQDSWDDSAGSRQNGGEVLTSIRNGKKAFEGDKSDATLTTPQLVRETHRDRFVKLEEWRNGNSQRGSGQRTITVHDAHWWREAAPGQQGEVQGDDDGRRPPQVADLSWGRLVTGPVANNYTILDGMGDVLNGYWQDISQSWVGEHAGEVLRIGVGLFDVGLGVVVALYSGGAAVVPAVGLMAVGLDQIITAGANLSDAERATPSVIEFGAARAAQQLGFSAEAAQLIGAFTPAVLSLGLGAWGTSFMRGGRAAGILSEGIAANATRSSGGPASFMAMASGQTSRTLANPAAGSFWRALRLRWRLGNRYSSLYAAARRNVIDSRTILVREMRRLTGYRGPVRYVHDLTGSSYIQHGTGELVIKAHAFYEPGGLKSVFLHEMAHTLLPIWATETQVDLEAARLARQIFGHDNDIILPFVN